MNIRTKYILFVSIIHCIALYLSFTLFFSDRLVFFISECCIIISIFIAYRIYIEFIAPVKLLLRGREAIADKDFSTKFVKTGKVEMDEIIDVFNEMIDQLKIERISQEEQHFFLEKMIYTSPVGIIIQDFDEKIISMNPRASAILGINEGELLSDPDKISNNSILKEIKNLQSGQSKTVIANGHNTFKIQKSHFIDRGFVRNFIMLEELTLELLAAEKKVYGKVIRMMAHEVNNTIGPVNSIIQSALSDKVLWEPTGNNKLKNALDVAVTRNNNLALFVKNFAEVVRLPIPNKQTVNITEIIKDIIQLFSFKSSENNIQFIFNPSDDLFLIEGDRSQLEQVFVNIIKNSIESIEGNGKIIVLTNVKERSLVIRDDGRGIELVNEDQLFSPFFSTKKDGQGIGLTLVKEILINHNALFNLNSISEGFTDFKISFQ